MTENWRRLILKISKLSLVGIILLIALASVGVAGPCEYGCTPGYWKNHYPWVGVTMVPGVDYPNVNLNAIPGYDTPFEMLQYQGGLGISGAERILLRAYIAAFLNKAEFGSGYSLNIPAVKAA